MGPPAKERSTVTLVTLTRTASVPGEDDIFLIIDNRAGKAELLDGLSNLLDLFLGMFPRPTIARFERTRRKVLITRAILRLEISGLPRTF